MGLVVKDVGKVLDNRVPSSLFTRERVRRVYLIQGTRRYAVCHDEADSEGREAPVRGALLHSGPTDRDPTKAPSLGLARGMSHAAAKYVWHEDDEPQHVSSNVVADEDVAHVADQRPAIVRLTHAWLNERGTPEIQPWPADAFDAVMDQLQHQQAILDSLMTDTSTSEEEHFRLNLVQLDADRAKWLVRSFLRARLVKLEAYASHLASQPSEQVRLSDLELGYVKRYEQLMSEHMQSAVLQYLPEPMRGMDDPAPGGASGAPGGMVTAPRLDAPVFIYCRDDGGFLTLSEDEKVALLRGSIHVVPYRAVRTLLHQRRVELL